MLGKMYPFWSFIIALILAQSSKPFVAKLKGNKFDWNLIRSSGGFPSSHTAGMAALSISVGIVEQFDSTIFAVCLAFSLIVFYDAANVRYYAGKNIQLTKRLVKDLKEDQLLDDEPIYDEPLKEILGHKWIEVVGGGILGVFTSIVLYNLS